jgi:hypothetical protein
MGPFTEYDKRRHQCRKTSICVAGSDNLNTRMFTKHMRSSDLSGECNYFKPICCGVTNMRPIYVICGSRYELRCARLFRPNTAPRSMWAVKLNNGRSRHNCSIQHELTLTKLSATRYTERQGCRIQIKVTRNSAEMSPIMNAREISSTHTSVFSTLYLNLMSMNFVYA